MLHASLSGVLLVTRRDCRCRTSVLSSDDVLFCSSCVSWRRALLRSSRRDSSFLISRGCFPVKGQQEYLGEPRDVRLPSFSGAGVSRLCFERVKCAWLLAILVGRGGSNDVSVFAARFGAK